MRNRFYCGLKVVEWQTEARYANKRVVPAVKHPVLGDVAREMVEIGLSSLLKI